MKPNIGLPLLLIGLLTAAAPVRAVVLAPKGEGQVLIYPYYTVTDETQTLLTVVNHDRAGKAVKLRLRESRNGRVTASLNLYLDAFDVWTAALFTAPDGTPALLTTDTSCTAPLIQASTSLPQLPDGRRYLPLSNADFSGVRADGGPGELSRAATGYVELIEMGSFADRSNSARFAEHVRFVPIDCPALVQAWEPGGYWSANPGKDLQPPAGKLSGALSLLQIEEGTAQGVEATALEQFSVVVQNTAPGASLPDLASAVTESAHQKVESTVSIDGRVVRSFWPPDRAIDAVSAVLSQANVRAEYSVEPALGARTDWVISMPTRRHYTDPALVATAVPPFNVRQTFPQFCEPFSASVYNREGARPPGSIDWVMPPPPVNCLCTAIPVLPVNRPITEALPMNCVQNPLRTSFSGANFENGFFQLGLIGNGHRSRPAIGGERYEGLPVLGFTLIRYRNQAARPGEIGIFSASRPQKGETECVKNNSPCPEL